MRRAVLAVLFAAAIATSGDASETKEVHELLWAPDVFEGTSIATVSRRPNGLISVFIAPGHRWQWGRLEGDGYDAGSRLERDVYEVSGSPLGSAAARHGGWRNPFRLTFYVIPLYRAMRIARDGAAVVQVFTDGNNNYLIVITFARRPAGE